MHGQETFVSETFFAFEKQKLFLTFFRNILFFQQMFPRLRTEETIFPQRCFAIGAKHSDRRRQKQRSEQVFFFFFFDMKLFFLLFYKQNTLQVQSNI